MIDTHAHLDSDDFDADIAEVIKRAQDKGVEYIINVGASVRTSKKTIELASKYDFIYAGVGIHPHDVGNITHSDFDEIVKLKNNKKVVSIGEVGLDYFRNQVDKKIQQEWFLKFLNLAYESKLPLIIHCREADSDMEGFLAKEKFLETPGVFHCFSGNKSFAKKALDKGFYISFSGTVTFPKAVEVQESARYVPLNRILVETDCPYLAPQCVRGKRNEPAFVEYNLEKLAEIKGMRVSELDVIIIENAKKLFRI